MKRQRPHGLWRFRLEDGSEYVGPPCPAAASSYTGRRDQRVRRAASMWELTSAWANSAATRIPFITAFWLEEPWPTMQTPRTPSRGSPIYSEESRRFLKSLKARRESSAPTCEVTVDLRASRSSVLTSLAVPSQVLMATFPTKPSQTATSVRPLKRSRPSMLPMKSMMGSARSRGKVSRVSWLPLESSSPMERSPTRGRAMWRTLRAYIWPMTANWTRLSGSQSTLAPTSSARDGLPVTVGTMVARAGRWTPANMPRTLLAVAMAAPVLPAVKKPRAEPSRPIRKPTRMEESRLARTAWAALSSMLIHSEAW